MSWTDDLEAMEPKMRHIVHEAHIWIGNMNTRYEEMGNRLAAAERLLKELADTAPDGFGAESSILYCPYCHESENADEMPVVHADDCPWKRARALFRGDL